MSQVSTRPFPLPQSPEPMVSPHWRADGLSPAQVFNNVSGHSKFPVSEDLSNPLRGGLTLPGPTEPIQISPEGLKVLQEALQSDELGNTLNQAIKMERAIADGAAPLVGVSPDGERNFPAEPLDPPRARLVALFQELLEAGIEASVSMSQQNAAIQVQAAESTYEIRIETAKRSEALADIQEKMGAQSMMSQISTGLVAAGLGSASIRGAHTAGTRADQAQRGVQIHQQGQQAAGAQLAHDPAAAALNQGAGQGAANQLEALRQRAGGYSSISQFGPASINSVGQGVSTDAQTESQVEGTEQQAKSEEAAANQALLSAVETAASEGKRAAAEAFTKVVEAVIAAGDSEIKTISHA